MLCRVHKYNGHRGLGRHRQNPQDFGPMPDFWENCRRGCECIRRGRRCHYKIGRQLGGHRSEKNPSKSKAPAPKMTVQAVRPHQDPMVIARLKSGHRCAPAPCQQPWSNACSATVRLPTITWWQWDSSTGIGSPIIRQFLGPWRPSHHSIIPLLPFCHPPVTGLPPHNLEHRPMSSCCKILTLS